LASSLIAIPYFIHQPKPLWEAIAWSSVFAAINLFQSARLFIERRPVKLTPEEEHVRRLLFQNLPPRKVQQLLSIGAWTTAETGERLLERGKSVESISLIVRGSVRVTRGDHVLGELVTGIVGAALFSSGTLAEVDAVAEAPVRAMRWQAGPLDRYLAAHPETRVAFQQYLARDLAGKLGRIVASKS
jgi:CRP-like cAMP-binding protein